jgi:hypothetical protein
MGGVVRTLQTDTPIYKLQVKTKSETWFHVPSRALQHRTLTPYQGGLRHCYVFVALDPASLLRRAPTSLHVLRLRTRPPCWEGSDLATRPVVPCGPRASNIKKSLVDLPMQLGLHVPNVRAHVSNAPNIGPSLTCKTCA